MQETQACSVVLAVANGTTALMCLIHLNALILSHADVVRCVPGHRLIFFIKRLCVWLEQDICALPLKSEVFKVLSTVLPAVKEIYGSHWSQTLKQLGEMWQKTTSTTDGE